MIGKLLGHYQIESRLGVGGMGEVYRARDTRLGRGVAIKVLPAEFEKDPNRLTRFEREAKVLAQLNHSNIATLFGFEQSDDSHFLVMELVEGETLAERIASGPIQVEQALEWARQIAEALEAAHEKGFIHRDLKPANVKVTPEGKVKLLDFGLAKAMEPPPARGLAGDSPTISGTTQPGMIFGTPAYMSPEQAKGLEADQRSDVFSFGCLLYELLSGTPPFPGDTVQEVVAGVLARDPDQTVLPADLNPRLPVLLRRCLEKNPRQRWHAVADARIEIEVTLADPHGLVSLKNPTLQMQPIWKRGISFVAAGFLLRAALAGTAVWWFKANSTSSNVSTLQLPLPVTGGGAAPAAAIALPSPGSPVSRGMLTLAKDLMFLQAHRNPLAISPDGTWLVYVPARRNSEAGYTSGIPVGLRLQPISQLVNSSKPGLVITIDGTERGFLSGPVFSPDGRFLAVYDIVDAVIRRIPVAGGTQTDVYKPTGPFDGMSWSLDDTIIFGQGRDGILRVPSSGGKAETIVAMTSGQSAALPRMLPGGEAVMFTLLKPENGEDWDQAAIAVQSLKTGQRKVVAQGCSDARYVATGHIVCARGANLLAVPFDLKRLEAVGPEAIVVEDVERRGAFNLGSSQYAISDSGALAYVSGAAFEPPSFQLDTVERSDWSKKPLDLPAKPYETPRISPDGKQLAYVINTVKDSNVYIYNLSGGNTPRQLTRGGLNTDPVWSNDGNVFFSSSREGDRAIFSMRADGSGAAERVTKPDEGFSDYPTSFANQQLLFNRKKGDAQDIWAYSLQEKKAMAAIAGPAVEVNGVFSGDGRWIAYMSNETGSMQVWAQPYPNTSHTQPVQISVGVPAAGYPLWAPNGKEMYLRAGAIFRMVNVLQTPPTLTVGQSDRPPLPGVNVGELNSNSLIIASRHFDISHDGKQLVMRFNPQQVVGPALQPQIHVAVNWSEELRQRVKPGSGNSGTVA